MKNISALYRFVALLLMLSAFSVNAHATIQAIIDTDEVRTTPVQHRYIHGVILDDAKFQILLPMSWNGKVVYAPLQRKRRRHREARSEGLFSAAALLQ